jgi:hypothetical protein
MIAELFSIKEFLILRSELSRLIAPPWEVAILNLKSLSVIFTKLTFEADIAPPSFA